jgi:hypothetical protein
MQLQCNVFALNNPSCVLAHHIRCHFSFSYLDFLGFTECERRAIAALATSQPLCLIDSNLKYRVLEACPDPLLPPVWGSVAAPVELQAVLLHTGRSITLPPTLFLVSSPLFESLESSCNYHQLLAALRVLSQGN